MPNIVLLKHSYQTFELVRTSYKKVCSNRHEIDCFEYFQFGRKNIKINVQNQIKIQWYYNFGIIGRR